MENHDIDGEALKFNVIMYLIELGKQDLARIVNDFTVSYRVIGYDPDWPDNAHYALDVGVPAQLHSLYLKVEEEANEDVSLILKVFDSYSGQGVNIVPKPYAAVTEEWALTVQRLLTGETVNNQGLMAMKSPYHQLWQGLNFASGSELAVAQALDRRGLMYFPGCMARLGNADSRRKVEPDFLICHEGKWGVLEVDGPHHIGERSVANDQERDRLLRHYGVKIVEHFSAERCKHDPEEVVDTFLIMLEKA